MRLTILGGGNMGGAILHALVKTESVTAEDILLIEPEEAKRQNLSKATGCATKAEIDETVRQYELVLLAVKPQVATPAMEMLSQWLMPNQVVISVPFSGGWNMIGLPVAVEDANYLALFPDAIENTLYSFDEGYQLVDEMEIGNGYWLRFPESDMHLITGIRVDELALEFEASKLHPKLLQLCPSKTVMFGCIDNGTKNIETPDYIAQKLISAAKHLPAEQIQAAPDCGLLPLPLDIARAKLRSMVLGAKIAREKL